MAFAVARRRPPPPPPPAPAAPPNGRRNAARAAAYFPAPLIRIDEGFATGWPPPARVRAVECCCDGVVAPVYIAARSVRRAVARGLRLLHAFCFHAVGCRWCHCGRVPRRDGRRRRQMLDADHREQMRRWEEGRPAREAARAAAAARREAERERGGGAGGAGPAGPRSERLRRAAAAPLSSSSSSSGDEDHAEWRRRVGLPIINMGLD